MAAADCPNPDPGVYQITGATGAAGTACAGKTFTVTTTDAGQGKVQFNPSSPIVLGPPGSATATCRIDFTFNVVKFPTKDALAGPGVQTAHLASISARHENGATGSVRPAQATTVNKANPTVTTSTQSTIALGQASQDTATISGGFNPTGTIDFDLFGPNDATCSGPVRSHSTVPVNGNGTYQSASFTPTQPGTYRWKATYSGDANNYAVLTACGDPAETFTVAGGSGTTTVNPTSADPGDVVIVGATGVTSPNSTYRLKLGTSAATCHTSPLVLGGNVVSDANGNIGPVPRTIPTNATSGQRWLCWVALADTNNHTTPTGLIIF